MLLFVIISLVPLVLTLFLTYTKFQTTLEQNSIRSERELATTVSVKIKSFIVSQIGILNTIATLYDQQFSVRQELSQNIVENILYRSENFSDISIVNKEGQETIRANRLLVFLDSDLRDLNNTEAFKIVKEKGLYIGPMYIKDGKPLFNLGRWIVDSQGTFSGAVFAEIDAKVMPEVMKKILNTISPGGRVFMVNRDGITIAHSDLSYILGERDLSDLPSVRDIKFDGENIGIPQKYNNENGQAVFGLSFPITLDSLDIRLPEPYQINWFLIVEELQDEILSEAYQIALFFLFISIGVLILIAIASVYFAKRISAPVESLYKATEEFAKGNLSYRTKINTKDEIGDLAANFDKMADSVVRSIDEIKKTEKMRSEFVMIAAHQLRTPLTGIKWSINYLTDNKINKLNEEQKNVLEKMSIATERVVRLVNNLLNINQIENKGFKIYPKKQSIIPVLEHIKSTLEGDAKKNNIKLELEIDTFIPDLNIDDHKIEVAISSVITNAIEYSFPDSVVEVKAEVKDKELILTIKDSGIGIIQEETDRIFTKFFRSKRAILQHTEGTGLGLYVSKNIIEQHGGKIWFTSEGGKGTTFIISLPIS